MADRVDASVPFVRFRVERELAAADLSGAEGKDAVIAALRPVFRDLPASAMREELIGLVADRTELAPALVASWLAQGAERAVAPAANGGNGAHAAARRRCSQPALDAAGRAERNFLAQCQASPVRRARRAPARWISRRRSRRERMRRAAEHIRARLAGENVHVPDDDEDDLAHPDRRDRGAGRADRTSEAALEAERLKLERVALDREIAAARAAGQPTHVLNRDRHELDAAASARPRAGPWRRPHTRE